MHSRLPAAVIAGAGTAYAGGVPAPRRVPAITKVATLGNAPVWHANSRQWDTSEQLPPTGHAPPPSIVTNPHKRGRLDDTGGLPLREQCSNQYFQLIK